MSLVVLAVVAAVGVGYGRGGRLSNLAHARLTRSWLVAAAVVAQGLLALLSAGGAGMAGSLLLVASYGALLAFVWSNRFLPGMVLVFLGFGLNAVVIAVNGAMPVSRAALLAVGADPGELPPGKHRLLGPDDPLRPLADVLPVPLLHTVVSVGDLILAAGVAVLVANLMLARPPPPGRRARTDTGSPGRPG
ncbi:MAG TPA: DUF5317 domain-containing protein [Egibacteraceae bacterium]|nr:DUF5317 domain-containing protein [Actinomycetota bacterium]HWB72567.1 DUF5317 domain-containing protein [Egibacteraceae bacterium]